MGIRKIPFVNGEYYHVFNRGVDKRPVFITAEQQDFFFRRLIMLNTTDNRRHITNHRSRHKDQLILGEGANWLILSRIACYPITFTC